MGKQVDTTLSLFLENKVIQHEATTAATETAEGEYGIISFFFPSPFHFTFLGFSVEYSL